jgi:hypothetical protein
MTDDVEEKGARVPQSLRVAAASTLIKAKEAIDQYMKQTDRLYKSADAAVQAGRTGVRELGAKAMDFAEVNIGSTFEFALKLVHAQSARDILVLQQEFLNKQVKTLNSQLHELGSSAVQGPATLQGQQAERERQEPRPQQQITKTIRNSRQGIAGYCSSETPS